MTGLELHIDELVLDGIGPHDPETLTPALREELARVAAEHGAPRPAALAQHAGALAQAVQEGADRS
jgi:hypothetical protein